MTMFSNLWCRNVDIQKLFKFCTAAVLTVRMDTVQSFGKPVIQSIFWTWKDFILANAYVLKQEFKSWRAKNQNSAFGMPMKAWHYDGQNKLYQEDSHQYIRLKIYLLLLYYDSVARRSTEKVKGVHILLAFSWITWLISDMSEVWILASSFDWIIAICSIKELVVQWTKSFQPINAIMATENITISHSVSIIRKGWDQLERSSKFVHCIRLHMHEPSYQILSLCNYCPLSV